MTKKEFLNKVANDTRKKILEKRLTRLENLIKNEDMYEDIYEDDDKLKDICSNILGYYGATDWIGEQDVYEYLRDYYPDMDADTQLYIVDYLDGLIDVDTYRSVEDDDEEAYESKCRSRKSKKNEYLTDDDDEEEYESKCRSRKSKKNEYLTEDNLDTVNNIVQDLIHAHNLKSGDWIGADDITDYLDRWIPDWTNDLNLAIQDSFEGRGISVDELRSIEDPDALEDEFVESRKRSRNESSTKHSKRSLVSRFNK